MSGRVTFAAPTQEEIITADLFVGSRFLETVEARYQYQTWGGERPPERRLTRNLTAMRNLAKANDLLIIERSIADNSHYRLRLVQKGTPEFVALTADLGDQRWGPLIKGREPAREAEVEAEIGSLIEREHQAFSLFEVNAPVVESMSRRIARSRAFQSHVSALYERRCAVCGNGLRHPSGRCETQSAHIVPRHKSGSDDARNGVQLCRSHHWAFDEGLFGINQDFRVVVPVGVQSLQQNDSLRVLDGTQIRLPADAALNPHPNALQWHLENALYNPDRLGH